MKIAVVGCGSMGCYFGAKLSKKNEVIYIDAFQKSIDSLNQNGITLKEGDKEESYVAPAFLAGKYKGSVDLVLLFVKSTQNIAALSQNAKFQDTFLLKTLLLEIPQLIVLKKILGL